MTTPTENKSILITGCAGFIGYHLTVLLCQQNYNVVGIDNLNDYYDLNLKNDRLKELRKYQSFSFKKLDLIEKNSLKQLFEDYHIDIVIHLAAQAGVRYSISHPEVYIDSNIIGFFNILEVSKEFNVARLLFASSSSVYGNSTETPFKVSQNTDKPISLYAATKKANEVLAYSYSHIHKMNITGLRFFTVYGPWGRPDMAYFSFTKKILNNQPIDVFNHGDLQRDFTYIDDITQSISKLINVPLAQLNNFNLFNIGNTTPVKLMDFIQTLEEVIGMKAIINYLPMQPGDVNITYADTSALEELINFRPDTTIKTGLSSFFNWYKQYYND
jgi:UDP-glucuronate 4-epimerase